MSEPVTARLVSSGEDSVVKVTVGQASAATTHDVTVSSADLDRLARPGESAEQFVVRCFEFLLAREPREAVLGRFDVAEIPRYWPEFEEEISRPG